MRVKRGRPGEHLQCIKGMAITLTVYVPFLFTLFKTKHVPLFSSFKFTKANENLHYSRTKRGFKEPFLPDQKSKEKQVLHTNLPPGKISPSSIELLANRPQRKKFPRTPTHEEGEVGLISPDIHGGT